MKNPHCLLLFGVAFWQVSFTRPVYALSVEPSCLAIVNSIAEDIEVRLGGSVRSIHFSVIDYKPYSPYKQNNQIDLELGIAHESTLFNPKKSHISCNIMNSTALLSGYADRLIKGCREIVRASFGFFPGDYSRSFSLIDNSVIREDEAASAPGSEKWGYQYFP